MQNWTSLSHRDLELYLAPAQLHALAQHAECGWTHVENLIAATVAQIRLEIAAHPANNLDTDPNTLPLALKSAACHLVIETLQSRFGNLALSQDQIRNAAHARALLHRVANGEVPLNDVTPPKHHASVLSARPPFGAHHLRGM